MTHASQGQHWYSRTGEPMYEVKAKDGTMRPATLRDARKFGWYPGVTSIIKCLAAPGLERWKVEQGIMAALTLPRVEGESNDRLLARIREDADEQARKARERGTQIHAAIQGHYEGKPPSEEFWPYVRGVTAAIEANFPERQWRPERPCAHVLGYGTKADLSCADVLLDFKGKDFTEAEKLELWDDHFMQLAATREALHLPGAECGIVFVSRTVPGLRQIIRADEADLARGWDMFRGLLNTWKAKNRYYPELWTEKEAA